MERQGISILFQKVTKSILGKCYNNRKTVKFLGLVIDIYLDETKADKDMSNTLSPGEAFALAAALSVDSLASGLGAGLVGVNIFRIAVISVAMGIIAITLGGLLGRFAGLKSKLDLSWMSGAILIVLAVLKLVK
jgi:putative sporulation protein YtaF